MLYKESDLPEYIKYWKEEFAKVLNWYYTDWLHNFNDSGKNMILSAKHRSFGDLLGPISLLFTELSPSPKDNIERSETRNKICSNEYFFSASMYYLSVIPQIISKALQPEIARNFIISSGWPAISLGMGGYMSAEQILYESELLPYPNEVDRYISLISIIHNFHREELSDYMLGSSPNLNNNAYSSFCSGVKNDTQRILLELDRQKDSFIQVCSDIKSGKEKPWKPMYLDSNCDL